MTHIPYAERLWRSPDFEVTYRLFSQEEGGRYWPPFQGIMWNFIYDEQSEKVSFMIFPEIINVNTGELFESNIPIPEYGIATMWILNPGSRPYHQERIKVGTRGYFMEGDRKVGVCEVTRLFGLFSNSAQ